MRTLLALCLVAALTGCLPSGKSKRASSECRPWIDDSQCATGQFIQECSAEDDEWKIVGVCPAGTECVEYKAGESNYAECVTDSGRGVPPTADGGDAVPTDTGPPPDTGPPAPECFFDNAKAGKGVGDHVDNIKVKDTEGAKYELHNNCGVAKAVWIILATGW